MVHCNMVDKPNGGRAAETEREKPASRTGITTHCSTPAEHGQEFMHQKRLIAQILAILKDVAPDADIDRLDPKHSFRDQFELDSVDYLNFVLAIEAAFAIRIPDVDYPRLSTLAGCAAYLERALAEDSQVAAPS